MDPITLLQKNMDSFTKSEQKLAQYILSNPRCVLGESITGIAKSADSSNAALVRLCQKLGFKGFAEFKFSMHRYLLSRGAERSDDQGNAQSPMQTTIEAYIHYIRQLPDFVDEEELRKAAKTICSARRITIWGFNRTFQSAKQLSHRLGRLGIFNQATDDWVVMTDDSEILTAKDLCIVISVAGRGLAGRDPLFRSLRESGCPILLITMNPKISAAKYATQIFTLPWISHDDADNFFEDQVIVYLFLELLLYEVAKIYPN